MTTSADIRKLRLLVQYKGRFWRLGKLIFTKNDASIYLVPYAPSGQYFFGSDEFAAQQVETTIPFKTQLSSNLERLPHLSIHEKGQVHAYIGKDRAGPLQIPPLAELRGQHVATVLVDTFDGLAPFEGTPKSIGAEQDFVFQIEETLQSGRLLLYINGREPSFGGDCSVVLTLNRPSLPEPVHLGLQPLPQAALGPASGKTGVTVIAGWDPITALTTAKAPFLFIRGE